MDKEIDLANEEAANGSSVTDTPDLQEEMSSAELQTSNCDLPMPSLF